MELLTRLTPEGTVSDTPLQNAKETSADKCVRIHEISAISQILEKKVKIEWSGCVYNNS